MEREKTFRCFYCSKEYNTAEEALLCQEEHESIIKRNNTESLNHYIVGAMLNLSEISDGQTTFGELYEDKYTLILSTFILLSKDKGNLIWYSDFFSDGSLRPGFFLIGLDEDPEKQITYLLPMKMRRYVEPFARLLSVAPPFKGHSTEDVRERVVKRIIEARLEGEN